MSLETREISDQEIIHEREQQRNFTEKVFNVELEFLRCLQQESGEGLGDLYDKYTNINTHFGTVSPDSEYFDFVNKLKEQVREKILSLKNIESNEWTDEASQIIHQANTELLQGMPPNQAKETKKLGSFEYNDEEAHERVDIKNFELVNGARYVEIHFPIKAVQQAKVEKMPGSRGSLQEVARHIVENLPEAQAVLGRSWLISHPIAKKIGFEIIKSFSTENLNEDRNNPFLMPGYWLQLLDENGEIKQEVVEYLNEHKKLPYDYAYGKIEVEDFLKKYLPDDLRGEVTLKEINSEYEKLSKNLDDEWRNFKMLWESMDSESLDVKVPELLPTLSKLMEEKCDYDQFISILKDLKNQSEDVENLRKNEKLKDIAKPVRDYLDEIKYIDKKINIK